ncbi:hypothetical protein E2C01_028790 [Portunus trituberculatus]|uniref:Uncharacterized protein n=1 Tax=Portunus trituberculatus TaxID=210409 RepID=A0A5B7EQ00_PORTR|nr:hypothetical protein [Portunus trituberculatus]
MVKRKQISTPGNLQPQHILLVTQPVKQCHPLITACSMSLTVAQHHGSTSQDTYILIFEELIEKACCDMPPKTDSGFTTISRSSKDIFIHFQRLNNGI